MVLKTKGIIKKNLKKKNLKKKPKWGEVRQIKYRATPQKRDAPGLHSASGAVLLYCLQSWDKFCACSCPWLRLWIC